jgi:glycosyltransferase involved in cell wall biosynthesis
VSTGASTGTGADASSETATRPAMLSRITPIVLTYNEEPNLERTLRALAWARRVIVVDSFSTDGTLEIAARFPNVALVQREFDDFAGQWNFALGLDLLDTEWVLALDADFFVTDELRAELAELDPPAEVSGYRARFRYVIDGTVLRGALYPPITVLFRRQHARYRQDGHAYRVGLSSGQTHELAQRLWHDDRKPLSRWLRSQERYAAEEAEKLARASFAKLRWPDRVRRVPFAAAPLVLLQCLLLKGGLLDGRAGAKYAGQRAVAELLISLELLDRRR